MVFASEEHESATIEVMKIADLENVLLRVATGVRTELWHMASGAAGFEKKHVVYSGVQGSDDDIELFDSPFRHGFVITSARRLLVFGSNGKSQLGISAEETAVAVNAIEQPYFTGRRVFFASCSANFTLVVTEEHNACRRLYLMGDHTKA